MSKTTYRGPKAWLVERMRGWTTANGRPYLGSAEAERSWKKTQRRIKRQRCLVKANRRAAALKGWETRRLAA